MLNRVVRFMLSLSMMKSRFEHQIMPEAHYGHFKWKDRSVKVVITEKYAHTILDLYVRVHEIEHAIQNLHAQQTRFNDHLPTELLLRYAQEVGAMSAESIYLRAIPSEHLRQLSDKIDADLETPRSTRKSFESIVRSALTSSNTEAYLESQWSDGRYGWNSMLFNRLALAMNLVITGSFFTWATINLFFE